MIFEPCQQRDTCPPRRYCSRNNTIGVTIRSVEPWARCYRTWQKPHTSAQKCQWALHTYGPSQTLANGSQTVDKDHQGLPHRTCQEKSGSGPILYHSQPKAILRYSRAKSLFILTCLTERIWEWTPWPDQNCRFNRANFKSCGVKIIVTFVIHQMKATKSCLT